MSDAVEKVSTIVILFILVVWLTHVLNGTATEWFFSKFKVLDTTNPNGPGMWQALPPLKGGNPNTTPQQPSGPGSSSVA